MTFEHFTFKGLSKLIHGIFEQESCHGYLGSACKKVYINTDHLNHIKMKNFI